MHPDILSAVQAHAAAEYPRESCGLIVAAGPAQCVQECLVRLKRRQLREHSGVGPRRESTVDCRFVTRR